MGEEEDRATEESASEREKGRESEHEHTRERERERERERDTHTHTEILHNKVIYIKVVHTLSIFFSFVFQPCKSLTRGRER